MSQDHDENGLVPDDSPLVRPYVAHSGPPVGAEAPSWPQSGPFAFPGPAHGPTGGPADGMPAGGPTPLTGPVADPAPGHRGARRSARAGRRSRIPAAVAGVCALGAVGALVLLLTGPDTRPTRADPPADLSLPALPARSPDAGTHAPGPAPSVRSAGPSASATGTPGATASPGVKSQTASRTSAPRPSSAFVTLRMGDSGPEVRALQEMLYGQGFTYVSVTGVYDGQTKRGVGQLQRDRSIKGDPQGVYGPNTQAAMQ